MTRAAVAVDVPSGTPQDHARGDAPVLTRLGNGVVDGELRDRDHAHPRTESSCASDKLRSSALEESGGVGAGEQEDLALRQLVSVYARSLKLHLRAGNHRELREVRKLIHPLQNPGVRKDTRVEIEWHLRRHCRQERWAMAMASSGRWSHSRRAPVIPRCAWVRAPSIQPGTRPRWRGRQRPRVAAWSVSWPDRMPTAGSWLRTKVLPVAPAGASTTGPADDLISRTNP